MNRTRLRAADAGLSGYVGEGSVAVVVVSPSSAKAVRGAGHARFIGHVRERAIAVVSIQRVLDGDAAVVTIPPVHKVNVLPAVPVEVGNAHPWTKFLEIDGHSFVSFKVRELDPRGRGDIHELSRR